MDFGPLELTNFYKFPIIVVKMRYTLVLVYNVSSGDYILTQVTDKKKNYISLVYVYIFIAYDFTRHVFVHIITYYTCYMSRTYQMLICSTYVNLHFLSNIVLMNLVCFLGNKLFSRSLEIRYAVSQVRRRFTYNFVVNNTQKVYRYHLVFH